MDEMDIDPSADSLPGGSNFYDVTSMFEEASRVMQPGEVIFADGVTIQDIGEPRLDSGVLLDEQQRRPPFNPLASLLPQEVCWIMDRALACEMEWHAGNTLSQTVFTILYVHHIQDLQLDIRGPLPQDAQRPAELVVVVLRAFMFGLLKSCDICWRELSKENVHDAEDWQSEKCDVSLLEGLPVKYTLQKLSDAYNWLSATTKVPSPWREHLMARLRLRKAMLEMIDLDIHKGSLEARGLLIAARGHLNSLQSSLPFVPALDSPARLAFDPYAARSLNSFLPLRVYDLPPEAQVWQAVGAFFDGWEEAYHLSVVTSLESWGMVGSLSQWPSRPRHRIPYLRSLTQSTFYNGVLVFGKLPLYYLVDRFFVETLGISRESFLRDVRDRWIGPDSPRVAEIERLLIKLIVSHIQSHWYNLPRRRRYLARSLLDWHIVYHEFISLTSEIVPLDRGTPDLIVHVGDVVLHWRLTALRELIFSGIQLELYTAEEKAFAYYYAAQVLEIHLECLDNLIVVISPNAPAYNELLFQREFLTALQIMSIASFSISMKLLSFSWQRMKLNFMRRYKWAFVPEYEDVDTPPVAMPTFDKFISTCTEILKDEYFSPSDSFKFAGDLLTNLYHSTSSSPPWWTGQWNDRLLEFLDTLASACENLHGVPRFMGELRDFDVSTLAWDLELNPWFPVLKAGQSL